ncbi:MAG: insulinase family protein [Eubacteriales bacterium]|nr:insulinase family protein [Eubacteriales bacterium]
MRKNDINKALSVFPVLILAASLAACGGASPSPSASTETGTEAAETADNAAGTATETEASALAGTETGTEEPGSETFGFKLKSEYKADYAGADVLLFEHEFSGADLLVVKNADPELGFAISYRTPTVDNSDANHVFEHSIICGSDKYPGKDLFFNLIGKTFTSYINAHTALDMTWYDIYSISEDQLMKAADVYLSCMETPMILKEENIFKREAIRYQLYDKDEPISMTGTVFAEDMGYMTNEEFDSLGQVIGTLYPGEIGANNNGLAWREYDKLTYENTIKDYERCYHFDNSLITLYGDINIYRFMEMLDRDYLSKHPKQTGRDDYVTTAEGLGIYKDGKSAVGFKKAVTDRPAYTDEEAENHSVITYAFDLSGLEPAAQLRLEKVMNMERGFTYSVFNTRLQDAGIYEPVSIFLEGDLQKPTLLIKLSNTNEDRMDLFKSVCDETFKELFEKGEDPEIVKSFAAAGKLEGSLCVNKATAGSEIPIELMLEWVNYGTCDSFKYTDETIEVLSGDGAAEFIKEAVRPLLDTDAINCALICSKPKPGLAEEIEAKQRKYLDDMKAAMSDEEIEQLIADTLAFDAWNSDSSEKDMASYSITPAELPDFSHSEVAETTKEGIDFYTVPSGTDGAAACSMYIDTSAFTNDMKYQLALFALLCGGTDTKKHSLAEIELVQPTLLCSLDGEFIYPDEAAGEHSHPMYKLSWFAEPSDMEDSAALLKELLTEGDYSDYDWIKYVIESEMEAFNPKNADAAELANSYSGENASIIAKDRIYQHDILDRGFYDYLKDADGRLGTDADFSAAFTEDMERISGLIANKDDLIFGIAAPEDKLGHLTDVLAAAFADFSVNAAGAGYVLPAPSDRRLGIYTNDSMNYTFLKIGLKENGFDFKYLPFMGLISNKYIAQKLRYEMGAYSADTYVFGRYDVLRFMSYSDPNVGLAIDVIRGSADFLEGYELQEGELDNYILSVYANQTRPSGIYNDKLLDIDFTIRGVDLDKLAADMNSMRTASAGDIKEASAALRRGIENGAYATAGPERAIENDKDYFAAIISYK